LLLRGAQASGRIQVCDAACAQHQIYLRSVDPMLRRFVLPLAVAALGLHAAAFAQSATDDDSELYDMLLGEIAQQRGDYALAAKTYLELAKRTRDPRIARR